MIKLLARLRNENTRFIQSLVKLIQYSFIRVTFVSSEQKMKRTSRKQDFNNRNIDKLKNTHSYPDICRDSTFDKRTLCSQNLGDLHVRKVLGTKQTNGYAMNNNYLQKRRRKVRVLELLI